jgi:DNA-binding HxlR family transcriptional regulator
VPDRRTYGDSCGIARALDRAGERWALLVVRELILGPKRFTDLREGLPGIGPDVLAQRLRDLEAGGVVRRRRLPPPAPARVYELTEWGAELEPVLVALGRWGSRAPLPDPPPPLSPDALAVALETTFDATRAEDLPDGPAGGERRYQVNLGEHGFAITVAGRAIDVARGQATDPLLTLNTDPVTLTALLWAQLPVDEARREGRLRVDGEAAEAARFLELFAAPVPAAV